MIKNNLGRRAETIAGQNVSTLTDTDIAAMKADLQSQLSSRRSCIEQMAADNGGFADKMDWREYLAWRNSTVALLGIIEKEIITRKGERIAAGGSPEASRNRTQIANLAAVLLADEILDPQSGLHVDAAAADAVRVAEMAVDAVWRVLDAKKTP